MNLRKRRRRKPNKVSAQTVPKKRRVKERLQFKEAAIKLLIALFLLVDLVFVIFAVRQCIGRKSIPPPQRSTATDTTQTVVMPESKKEAKPHIIQVEVLNGCGVPKIADRFTEFLRKNNFDVVKTGNYETFGVAKTIVIDRKGKIDNAVRVAKLLGLPGERALQEQNESFSIDATVILGSDFRQLSSWKKMEKENVHKGF
jgi:hypothetical protein